MVRKESNTPRSKRQKVNERFDKDFLIDCLLILSGFSKKCSKTERSNYFQMILFQPQFLIINFWYPDIFILF